MKPIEIPFSDPVAAARSYLAAGLSVLPIRTDGTKAPAVSKDEGWQWLQHERLTSADVPGRFRGRGVGIVCGQISGGRTVIDIDDPDLIEPFRVAMEQVAPGLLDRLPRVGTPKDGEHYHLRCDGPTPPNERLAMGMRPPVANPANASANPVNTAAGQAHAATTAAEAPHVEATHVEVTGRLKLKALIETRGEGGYVVAPGSPVECHPRHKPYFHKGGPPIEQTPVVTADERSLVFTVARTFNEVAPLTEFAESTSTASEFAAQERLGSPLAPSTSAGGERAGGERVGFERVGDDFNARAGWPEILAPHGWTECGGHGPIRHWKRPGKHEPGTSATTGCTSAAGNDLLCVFSTNAAPLEIPFGRTCGTYSKFAAYAKLNCHGDLRAATRHLATQGYGPQTARTSAGSDPGLPTAEPALPDELHGRFGNARYEKVESEGKANGRSSGRATTARKAEPMAMAEVIADLRRRVGGLPYRSGSALFVPSGRGGVDWFKDAPALFGWIQAELGVVDWCRGRGFVGREDYHAELARSSPEFEAVEPLPHCPPIPKHYYMCGEVAPGDGSVLRELLARFNPAGDLDADLLKGAFVTPLWGGAGGARPGFAITSDAGRGMGKSAVVKAIGLLYDGLIDFGQHDDAASIKQRLLSPEGLSRRVALIDNVKSHRFSSSDLEALVTAPYISGKRMYFGEGRRPNTITWFLTLNGASLSTDIAQRFACIKLAPPKRSAEWEDETNAFIERNRAGLIADIVAFYTETPYPLERFSRWASWEAAVLSRLPEPSDLQRMLVERQGETDAEADEMSIVEDHFATRLAEAGYDPNTAAVHIPSGIATTWFCEAVGDRRSPTAVTRTVRQLSDEGALKLLSVNPCKRNGRGLLWNGTAGDVDYGLAETLRFRERTYGVGR